MKVIIAILVGLILIFSTVAITIKIHDNNTPYPKVVLEQFIVTTNPEKGMGYYLGRTLDSQIVIIEDKACIYGMGDTITPFKILK